MMNEVRLKVQLAGWRIKIRGLFDQNECKQSLKNPEVYKNRLIFKGLTVQILRYNFGVPIRYKITPGPDFTLPIFQLN